MKKLILAMVVLGMMVGCAKEKTDVTKTDAVQKQVSSVKKQFNGAGQSSG